MKLIKYIFIFLAVVVVGLVGYWYFFVYPQQQQLVGAYENLHQAALQAQNNSQQVNSIINAAQNPPTSQNVQKAEPTVNNSNATSIAMQTVVDPKNRTEIQIPASWKSIFANVAEYAYSGEQLDMNGQPQSPVIYLYTMPLGKMTCDQYIADSLKTDSNMLTISQEQPINIPGAQTAVKVTGVAHYMTTGQIQIHACGTTETFDPQVIHLHSAADYATANTSLDTFKILQP